MKKVLAKAASFAHLLGLPKAARAEEEDEDKKQRPDESDEDYAKRMKRMEEEDKEEPEDGGADGESDDKEEKDEESKKAESEEDDEDEKDSKKSKKAKKAEDDEDSGDAKKARKAERQRCAAIFASTSAGVRPDLAAHLAFNTDMTSGDAIAMLEVAAAGSQKSTLASRMSGVNIPNVGVETEKPDPTSAKSQADKIIAAAKKARGEA